MPRIRKDLTGQTFGRLTVESVPHKNLIYKPKDPNTVKEELESEQEFYMQPYSDEVFARVQKLQSLMSEYEYPVSPKLGYIIGVNNTLLVLNNVCDREQEINWLESAKKELLSIGIKDDETANSYLDKFGEKLNEWIQEVKILRSDYRLKCQSLHQKLNEKYPNI